MALFNYDLISIYLDLSEIIFGIQNLGVKKEDKMSSFYLIYID